MRKKGDYLKDKNHDGMEAQLLKDELINWGRLR